MDWIDKTTSGNRSGSQHYVGGKNVLVSVRLNSTRHKMVAFNFSGYAIKGFDSTGYIKLAVSNDRVYFAPTDSTGYKLNEKSEGRIATTTITLNATTAILAEWAGRHALRYDAEQGLYYISKLEE